MNSLVNEDRINSDAVLKRLQKLWPSPPSVSIARVHDDLLDHEVAALIQGKLRFFGGHLRDVGAPPQWHKDWKTGIELSRSLHWSKISDFGMYDIKRVWEPNRFTWVFPLVRSFARTGDPSLANLFWSFYRDWMQNNPPNSGANWKCGQESALRLIAVSFAAMHLPADQEMLVDVATLALATGQRIANNIGYALMQKNNHGLSESVGMWLAGFIVDRTADAGDWQTLGRKLFIQQVRELFNPKGCFSQYSVNYQRLALEISLVGVRLAAATKKELPEDVINRLAAAGQWLRYITDDVSGSAPRLGQWDGAHLLPLSPCGISDFRPVIQASAVMLEGRREYGDGPWEEQVLWLTGSHPSSLPLHPVAPNAEWNNSTGFVVMRDEQSMVVVRAGDFAYRPSQADLLHMDLWWRGTNIVVDPGTYSYSAPSPWDNPLASTRFHNTLTVREHNQMIRLSRFLWSPWPESNGRFIAGKSGNTLLAWEGHHDGYKRLGLAGLHWRAVIRLGDGSWVVVDRMSADRPVNAVIHWLFDDFQYKWNEDDLTLSMIIKGQPLCAKVSAFPVPLSADVVRAAPDSPRGWIAPTYGERHPAVSLRVTAHGTHPSFITYIGPEAVGITCGEQVVIVDGLGWVLTIDLAQPVTGHLLKDFHLERTASASSTRGKPCTTY